MARPGSVAAHVNGDEGRDTWFCPSQRLEVAGYDARQVNDLVRRVAAELDAGRPAGLGAVVIWSDEIQDCDGPCGVARGPAPSGGGGSEPG